jgi:hypothetical protein
MQGTRTPCVLLNRVSNNRYKNVLDCHIFNTISKTNRTHPHHLKGFSEAAVKRRAALSISTYKVLVNKRIICII